MGIIILCKGLSPGGVVDYFGTGAGSIGIGTTVPLDIAEWNGDKDNPDNFMGTRDMSTEATLDHVRDMLAGNWKEAEGARREYHEEAMWREHAVIIDPDTGTVMWAGRGEADSVGVPTEMMAGKDVLHSHNQDKYGGYAGPQSFADVQSLRARPRAIEADAAEGYYRMEIDANSDVNGFIAKIYSDRKTIEKRLNAAHQRAVDKYMAGGYPSKRAFYADNATLQYKVIHRYYQNHAADYGIKYSFTKNAEASDTMFKARAGQRTRTPVKPKPKLGGRGSQTTVMGKFQERGTGKTYVQYKTHGKVYLSDGKQRFSGDKVQSTLNGCTRTGTMSIDKFLKWKKR